MQFEDFAGCLPLALSVPMDCWRQMAGHRIDPEAKFVITERGVFVLRFGHHVEDWYRP